MWFSGTALNLLGAILIGGAIGSIAGIERRLNDLGDIVQRRFAAPGSTGTIAEGFVTASIVVLCRTAHVPRRDPQRPDRRCVASRDQERARWLLRDRIRRHARLGVLLSLVVIVVYQGGLAAGASVFSGLLSDAQLREMSAVGGLLIVGVGLKLLKIREVQVADYLPAILIAPLLVAAASAVGGFAK